MMKTKPTKDDFMNDVDLGTNGPLSQPLMLSGLGKHGTHQTLSAAGVPTFELQPRTFSLFRNCVTSNSAPFLKAQLGKGSLTNPATCNRGRFWEKNNLLHLSFSRLGRISKSRTRAFFLTTLLLGGCSHAQIKTHQINADFQPTQQMAGQDSSGLLQLPLPSDAVSIVGENGRAVKTELSKKPRTANLKSPLRFAFTAVPADMILRRIAQYTDLQFFADEELIANSSVTLDLTVNNSAEIYSLIDTVGSMLGVAVKWDGKKAIFNRTEGSSIRPVDGYLITPIKLGSETAQIVAARYGVECSIVGTLTLCLGENASLEATLKFIEAVEVAQDLIAYKMIKTKSDLGAITDGLGLTDRVAVKKLDADQWLLVANDPRHFSLIVDVAKSASQRECETYVFTPLHLDAVELLQALETDNDCGAASIVGPNAVLVGSPESIARSRALLTKLDAPKPIAKVFVLIVSTSEAQKLGADVEGFTGRLPSSDIFDSVQLTASLSRASGWRTLEIVTDGNSTSNVTQTDRVQGNVIVTDGGSQVSGVENRTVGLSVNMTGVVTQKGYRGRVSVSDSSLDGDITRTSACAAYVTLELFTLAPVCSYDRDDNSFSASIFKGNKSKNADGLQVFVGLVAHETASLETLRKVIS